MRNAVDESIWIDTICVPRRSPKPVKRAAPPLTRGEWLMVAFVVAAYVGLCLSGPWL